MTCPVPEEQQPINEYLALKESYFFRWGTLELDNYLKVIVWIWLGWWIITGPVAAVSFPPKRDLWQFLWLGSIGATFGLSLPLTRLFLGWTYIKDRLQSPTVFYEESGWYDGQTWQKPEVDILKERLLVTYEVLPILSRIKNTVGFLVGFFLLQIVGWQILV